MISSKTEINDLSTNVFFFQLTNYIAILLINIKYYTVPTYIIKK